MTYTLNKNSNIQNPNIGEGPELVPETLIFEFTLKSCARLQHLELLRTMPKPFGDYVFVGGYLAAARRLTLCMDVETRSVGG